LAAALAPLLIYNLIKYHSFAVIPGNLNVVMTCYHGDSFNSLTVIERLQALVLQVPRQFMKFISSYEHHNSLSFYAHRDIIDFMRIFIIPFNLLLILALVGVAGNYKHRGVQFIALLTGAYIGTMLYFEMFYRFRIPVVPLITVLAGCGINSLLRQPRGRRLAGTAAVIILTAVTYVNPEPLRSADEKVTVVKVMIYNKMYGKAERFLLRLGEEKIFPQKCWADLAAAYYNSGERESANRVYKEYLMLKQRLDMTPDGAKPRNAR
jgi:hypothetical protein